MTNNDRANYKSTAFICPLCNVYSHMKWQRLYKDDDRPTLCWEAECSHCNNNSIWKENENTLTDSGQIIYPDFGNIDLPENEMPDEVKNDYKEAASIITRSPRGAASLLRLALQNLLISLGENGKDLNSNIRSLAKKGHVSSDVIQAADTMRLTGNSSTHPSEMQSEDRDHVATKMFSLLNHIVRQAITEPKKLKELYERTPVSKRIAAEKEDKKFESKRDNNKL